MRRTRCRAEDGNLECGVGGIGGTVFGFGVSKSLRRTMLQDVAGSSNGIRTSHLEIVSHCHV
jgi:hypothetical protein